MINRRTGFFTLIMFAMLISLFFIPKQVKAGNSPPEEISIPICMPSDLNIDLGHTVLPIGSSISSRISIINYIISSDITITDVQAERTGECMSGLFYLCPPIVLMQEDNFTVGIYIITTLPGSEAAVPGYNEMYITISYECSGEEYILNIYKDWTVVGADSEGWCHRNRKNWRGSVPLVVPEK